MKPFFWICTMLFCQWSMGQSDDAFALGTRALKADNYTEAIRLYEMIIDEGWESKELYVNLARAYYGIDDIARSILNYERALLLDPKDKAIGESLTALNESLDYQITEIEDFILYRMYLGLVNQFSSTVWAVLHILSVVVLLAVLFQVLFIRKWTFNRSLYAILGCVVAIVVLSFLNTAKYAIEKDPNSAIVIVDQTSIYEAPDDRSEAVAPLGSGNKVFILDQIGDWYKVRLLDKDLGWIEKENVEPI